MQCMQYKGTYFALLCTDRAREREQESKSKRERERNRERVRERERGGERVAHARTILDLNLFIIT